MPMSRTIYPREVERWPPMRKSAFLYWLGQMKLEPRSVLTIRLNADGTVDATLVTRDAQGKRMLDPENPGHILTVIQNFTPKVPCPETL